MKCEFYFRTDFYIQQNWNELENVNKSTRKLKGFFIFLHFRRETDVTIDEMNVVKKLLVSHELSVVDQKIIVDLINRICEENNRPIRITYDRSNESYVALHYQPKKGNEGPKLTAHCSVKSYNQSIIHEEDKQMIKECFAKWHGDVMKFHTIKEALKRPSNPENQFVFVLGYALCLAIGQSVATFQSGLQEGENTEKVRKVIVQLLQPGKLQLSDLSKNIWENGEINTTRQNGGNADEEQEHGPETKM